MASYSYDCVNGVGSWWFWDQSSSTAGRYAREQAPAKIENGAKQNVGRLSILLIPVDWKQKNRYIQFVFKIVVSRSRYFYERGSEKKSGTNHELVDVVVRLQYEEKTLPARPNIVNLDQASK